MKRNKMMIIYLIIYVDYNKTKKYVKLQNINVYYSCITIYLPASMSVCVTISKSNLYCNGEMAGHANV